MSIDLNDPDLDELVIEAEDPDDADLILARQELHRAMTRTGELTTETCTHAALAAIDRVLDRRAANAANVAIQQRPWEEEG